MGYSIKHAYNGWAALAAAVLAGCSSNSKPTAQEREEAFAENQRISAGVRQTFAITQRQPQTQAPAQAPVQAPVQAAIQSKVQSQFQPQAQNISTRVAQAPVPFELDPRDYAPDSRPQPAPQIRPITTTVATTNRAPSLAAALNPAPTRSTIPAQAPAFAPSRAPARTLTIASADSDATSALPVPIDLTDTQPATLASTPAVAPAAKNTTQSTPRNPATTIGTPEIGSALTVDANGTLKSFTLRRPPSAAFLAAPEKFRSVTIDRLGHVIAWEPVTGPTRASGLIRRNINPDPKFPYVELVAEPNPNARSESAHPGLVFTPLADGSLVYTCE